MPARMAGVPTTAAVVAAASKPAENRQARVSIFGSFRGGDLPPPLLRCEDQARIIRPPWWRRTPAMIKRRLTRALATIGLAGGLLVGTAGVAGADGIPVKTNNRTDIVTALLTGFPS